MDIMLVTPSLGSGGAERVASTLVNAWVKAGENITLVTLNAAMQDFYSLDPRVKRVRLDLTCESTSWYQFIRNNLKRVRQLRSVVRSCGPDVVLSFIDSTNVLVLLATRGLRVPVVVEEHTDPRMHHVGVTGSLVRRFAYRWANAIVVLTSSVVGWARGIAGSAPVCVIPNPIGEQFLTQSATENIRSEYTIVAMGRMIPLKGFDMLLRAFARCASNHRDWNLRIVGEGPEQQRLNALIIELGLSNRVKIDPVVKKPEKVLRASDLFVLSSRYEGFPMVLLEAMASGLPVVSFDCPSGPSEMIQHGVNGFLVRPNDIDALAAALDDLMSAPDERERLGIRAVEVVERYGLPTVMSKWNDLLIKVTSKNPAATFRSYSVLAPRDSEYRGSVGGSSSQ